MENQEVFLIGVFVISLLILGMGFTVYEFSKMSEEKNGIKQNKK